ncbi:MAG TPA: hypothetical protein IAD15_07480 [Candidatus Fimiplasma intestinipullorum]|uniref:Uncharacterized protein n=1 Tax=Candidatus Fimiplasma intestinipullorum TaxID=2840825 RepID=A0A9D1HPK0_9FIRM|nr:hypothetical protein [Candidatus Fimiplasma intestinipullorum]
MSMDRHFIFFIDEYFSIESQSVQKAFASINQPGALFSLFYLHDPMHWVYLLEILPLDALCIVPFCSLDLPTAASLEEIFDTLALLHQSLNLEESCIYWFSQQPLNEHLSTIWPFTIIPLAMP